MADYTIASQVGGGGQNAMAGGGGGMFNPNTMFQLMQMKQTMELQRAAEQRALAGEARAAALHAPALEAANLRVREARLGLGAAERTEQAALEEKAFNDRYFGLLNQGQDPSDPLVMEPFKKGDAKFYSYLRARKATEDANALAGEEKTVKLLTDSFNHLKQTADMTLRNIDRITDQKSYSAIRDRIIRAAPHIAGALKPEFTPETLADLKNTLEGLQEIKPIDLGENIKGLMRGNTILGLVDPTKPGYIDNSLAAIETVKKAIPAAAPTGAQPGAAAPQTMQFSGMGQLAPAGQQAAQAVMAAFPGARITSGYRSPQKNTDVGGASRSYHLTGNAIDVVPPAGMPMNVFAAQLQAQLGPQGYTVMYGDPGHLDHVHIQPGNAMNVPRTFSPSVAATDIAAGRDPRGMEVPLGPANAMAPLAALSLMQPQNAMVQTPANIAPGLTAATAPAAGIGVPAAPGAEGRPVRGPNEPWAAYNNRVKKFEEDQRKLQAELAKEERTPALEEQKTAARLKAEKEAVKPKVQSSYVAAQQELDKQLDNINAILERPISTYLATGPIAGRSWSPTGFSGEVQATQAIIDQLKAGGGLSALTELRQNSPTGGAVGNVSNQEGTKFEQKFAALSQLQDTAEFKKQLRILAADLKNAKKRLEDAYSRDYGENAPDASRTFSADRRPDELTVVAPNGTPYSFKDKASADAFFKQVYK